MHNLFVLADETTSASIKTFVDSIISAITSNVSLTDVATVVAAIIAAGIISMFAWKFARKGFAFVKNALSGKSGRI